MIVKFLIWLFVPRKSCKHDYELQHTRTTTFPCGTEQVKSIHVCRKCFRVKEVIYIK